jgi:hypothetical protein
MTKYFDDTGEVSATPAGSSAPTTTSLRST